MSTSGTRQEPATDSPAPTAQAAGQRPTTDEIVDALDVAARTVSKRFPPHLVHEVSDATGEAAVALLTLAKDPDWRLPSGCAITTYAAYAVYWGVLKRLRQSRQESRKRVALDVGRVAAPPEHTPSRWYDEAWRQQVAAALEQAILTLPPRDRRVIRRLLAGDDYRAISADLDLERGTVRTIACRARRKLAANEPLRQLLVPLGAV